MTVKELREQLNHYPDDKNVEIFIEDILDSVGDPVNGRATIEHIGYGLYEDTVELSGYDLYS